MTARDDASGVAIIGMACRFPGAHDLNSFWRNLCNGVESITPLSDDDLLRAGVPPETLRDPAYVKAASLLDDVDAFDAPFFEYSTQEARIMDPQQRLLLEVAWEAFEDAGLRPGGATGVFVGCGGVVSSYLLDRLLASRDLPGYTGSLSHLGNDKDFAGTRISYKLNLTGPSINVQTACSTSLVAVHLACQSVLSGECDMALAGASAIRVPQRLGYVSVKGGILSPDGHCRAFDANAAGTIFGSGVGIVLLKELSQAITDRDNIYAVIRGSAVNNDGAEKVSYTASSVPGQARAMVEAMGIAQIDAEDIDYVECHGTGTAIGDPLEIGALTRAFRSMTERRGYCAIGSVKSNVGHLEQCAGMAGLIKAALAVRHKEIPPSLHVRNPNPKIDFAASPFFVNTDRRDWLRNGHARHAAVNSLGLGGTNAFLVLQEAPETTRAATSPRPHLFVLSAKSETALQAAIDRHSAFLHENLDLPLGDICATLATGRNHFPYRFAAVANSVPALREALSKSRSALSVSAPSPRKLAFLFSGQASQYAGMGDELYRNESVFRETFDRCAALFRAEHGCDLCDIVFGSDAARLGETINTQPALYAVQAALVDLWRSFGIRPDAVLGHSIGEFAAAYCAGVYSLEDGFTLVLRRAALMQALPRGAMASIPADEATVAKVLRKLATHNVAIAAVNAPRLTVISGAEEQVKRVLREFEQQGTSGQLLSVSHAFHSPLMTPAMDALHDCAARIPASPPMMDWMSTATGAMIGAAPDADYWCEHAQKPVRFRDAIRALAETGIHDFVEIGPGSVLLALGRQSSEETDCAWLPSLQQRKERQTVLQSLGAMYERGRDIDWTVLYPGMDERRLSLPTYPFEPHRYWLDYNPAAAGLTGEDDAQQVIGTRLRSAADQAIFEFACGLQNIPYLDDHRIYGHPVLPLTAGLVALHGAAQTYFGANDVELANVRYGKALIVPNEVPAIAQSVFTPPDGHRADCRIASLNGENWQTHIVARAEKIERSTDADTRHDLQAIRARCASEIPVDRYYERLRTMGLHYGLAFRGIASIHHGDQEVLTRVKLPEDVRLPLDHHHPAFLDACLHIYPSLASAFAITEETGDSSAAYLPVALERFSVHGAPFREAWVHAVRRGEDAEQRTLTVDLTIHGGNGARVLLQGLTLKVIPETVLLDKAESGARDWLYRLDWTELKDEAFPEKPGRTRSSWLLLADKSGVADALARQLENRGDTCCVLASDDVAAALKLSDPIERLAEHFLTAIEQATRTYLPPLRGMINLWPLDVTDAIGADDDIERAQRVMIGSAAALFRAAVAAPQRQTASARVYLVTRNAVQTRAVDGPVDPMAAPVWGLGRSAAIEHPQFWGGLIDLDAAFSAQAAAEILLQQVSRDDGEDQVALRPGKRFAARLVRESEPADAARMDAHGIYLISGGLGTVGQELAKWLITRHGIKHLVLVSRRGGEDPRAKAVKSDLTALGADVSVRGADVTNADEMGALFAELSEAPLPLKGVFHCAGLLDDGILVQMDWAKFSRVMMPKVAGAWLLDRLTRDCPLDHFVVFSSVLGQIGSAGQANYAAANTFLDALVDRRLQQGRPALGLNFGPWAADGLATASGEKGRALWRSRGTRYIETDQAWSVFDALIGRGSGHATITITDWPVFFRQFVDVPPLYRALQNESGAQGRAKPRRTAIDLRPRLIAAPAEERRALLTDLVRDAVTETIGETNAIDPRRPLREYGLDSLMSVTLVNQLETATGVRIPMSRMIRGPSLDELVDDLLRGYDETAGAVPEPVIEAPANGSWLTPLTAKRSPKFRLFCFPFAGGGSAVYRNWTPRIHADLDLIAIEPPGRLSRIDEEPVSEIADFVDHVIADMQDRLDVPFAFFGHCLGGLTMYETMRRLAQSTPYRPVHLFVSGARPPDKLADQGDFEERLVRDLMGLAGFRLNMPTHAQPDDVFSEIIRHFNILASEQLLEEPELRDLMLPIVRAEFRMANNYIFTEDARYNVPITCFYAHDDPYVTREHALGWGRFTDSRFQAYVRPGSHFAVVDDMDFITGTINRELIV